MSGEQELKGPDLAAGVSVSTIPEGGILLGHAQGQAVLLSRRGKEIFAIGATCTHYSGPLGEGLIVGETVRCPWHHACFNLRTGEALLAPALSPVSRWEIERRGDTVVVTKEIKVKDGSTLMEPFSTLPADVSRVLIVGAGVAGNAAAEMLRRRGFTGTITMIGADPAGPYDRPNLSKDYLAGTAQEDWLPLHSTSFYKRHEIELLTSTRVKSIDVPARKATLENGETREYDRLLLCTGADPIALKVPGADQEHVFYLRTLADSRAIIAAAAAAVATRVVVIGASFIGLEAAASLRTRGLEVTVVAPDAVPFLKVFGERLGSHIKSMHEQHGVKFALEKSATAIGEANVTLDDGTMLPADIVVIGIGVRPSLDLAKQMGLTVDNGVIVNEFLESSASGVYAAGDIASFPYRTGDRVRVEHFVVAERLGQFAAENILGARKKYDDVPFFWTAQFGTEIRYVGHASNAEDVVIGGDIEKNDAIIAYKEKGKAVAFASLGRDYACLVAEHALATDDTKTMDELTAH